MCDYKESDWKRLLDEMVTETDRTKLEEKAVELENALFFAWPGAACGWRSEERAPGNE
jgi:hypothetical protein